MDRDPAHASAEYYAEFRSDIESFIKLDEVARCVTAGIEARPPLSGCRYKAFVDPSGGSSDSMTLGIAHKEADKIVIDRVIERRPPFSPASVVDQFAETLKLYRVREVTGDRYAGEWPREQFRRASVTYDVASKAKSDLYVAFPPPHGAYPKAKDHERIIAPCIAAKNGHLCSSRVDAVEKVSNFHLWN